MPKYLFINFIILCPLILTAQVPVRDEPRHHNVFENESVRILDAYIAPKDTTQYHLHNTPSVFIILANCKVSSQLWGGQPQSGANLSGTISYDSMNTPRNHRVWNEDTVWFHVMDIELTAKTFNNRLRPLNNKSLNLIFNDQAAIGYKVKLPAQGKLLLPSSQAGYLLVSLSDAVADHLIFEVIQHRIMKAGHFIWIEPGMPSSLSVNEKGASFVLLQLK